MTRPATSSPLLAGVELGGTAVRCAVADSRLTIVHATTFRTADPTATLARAARFFNAVSQRGFAALGVASFGPLDVNARSKTYGQIASTPKTAWQGVNVLTTLAEATRTARAVCETDVNAAALAEYTRGAACGVDSCAYVTVGTGIGAGYISHGRVLGWGGHPEFGHIRIPHDRAADPFTGCCPYHGDCLEGLASGESVRTRWNVDPRLLPPRHEGWLLEGHYIAIALANLTFTLSPQRIVLGGGIGLRLPRRALVAAFRQTLGGYLSIPSSLAQSANYLVKPHFKHSGLVGALLLAQQAGSLKRPPVGALCHRKCLA